MPSVLQYQVHSNEPSIYVEVYLPKKARLQGVLYNTLTAGFSVETVRDYFRDLDRPGNEEKKEMVRRVSSPGWTVLREDLTPDEIEKFPRLFFGYSMYEVEGVFLKQVKNGPVEDDDCFERVEEVTQVIRMIFKYSCANEKHDTIDYIKAAMRDPLSEIGTIDENYFDQGWIKNMNTEVRSALQPFYQWVRYVGWFLYGFLLYNVCEGIVELCKQAPSAEHKDAGTPAKEPPEQQDQIWVTSLWNLNVNVIDRQ